MALWRKKIDWFFLWPYLVVLAAVVSVALAIWWFVGKSQVSSKPAIAPLADTIDDGTSRLKVQTDYRRRLSDLDKWLQSAGLDRDEAIKRVEEELFSARVPAESRERHLQVAVAVSKLQADASADARYVREQLLRLVRSLEI